MSEQNKKPNTNQQEKSNEGTDDDVQFLQLRKIWMDSLETMEEQYPDVPDVSADDPETAGQKLKAYVLQLQQVIAINKEYPAGNIFDRCLGQQRWHIGKALLLLKPLRKGVRGLVKHGEWQKFLDSAGLDEIMSWRCRAIADYFPRRQDVASVGWQWTAMVDALPARKRNDDAPSHDDENKSSDSVDSDSKSIENDNHQDSKNLIEPIGNHIQRVGKNAEELLGATATALKIIEDGRASGFSISTAREGTSFKSFVAVIEATANIFYDSIVNLFKLAEITSSSELSDIQGDLNDFLKRHKTWRGSVRGGDK